MCGSLCVKNRHMGEVDVQIRKRKMLYDQIRSMSVWKKVENADFGVTPWELRGE